MSGFARSASADGRRDCVASAGTVTGEERRGLTAEQRTLCDRLVRIPMQDNLDSLNAAVAGSLLLYEVLRPASG